jgi:hypothetical protein
MSANETIIGGSHVKAAAAGWRRRNSESSVISNIEAASAYIEMKIKKTIMARKAYQ